MLATVATTFDLAYCAILWTNPVIGNDAALARYGFKIAAVRRFKNSLKIGRPTNLEMSSVNRLARDGCAMTMLGKGG
jgi:hypothetical protein